MRKMFLLEIKLIKFVVESSLSIFFFCLKFTFVYGYFEKGCRKKCARDIPQRLWDMTEYSVPDIVAVEPALVAFL